MIAGGTGNVHQGVCATASADLAMPLGVNHSAAPFEFVSGWDVVKVAKLRGPLDGYYGGQRCRISGRGCTMALLAGVAVRPHCVRQILESMSVDGAIRISSPKMQAPGADNPDARGTVV